MTKFSTTKSLNNLYGSHITKIKKRVDHFVSNPHWYTKNGVPYTLGLLLYGKPGCGKTSIIKAIAKDTKRHIINIKLKESTTQTQLKNLFFNDTINVTQNGITKTYYIPTSERIYVMEDIDCLSNVVLSRETKFPDFDFDFNKDQEQDENQNQNQNQEQDKNQNKEQNQDETTIIKENGIVKFKKQEEIDIESFDPLQKNFDEKKVSNLNEQFSGNSILPPEFNKNPESDSEFTDRINLSFILNLFDGILETPGRIFIMTTNYPDRLDSALTRPGRVDLRVEFTACDNEMIYEMFKSFYDLSDMSKYKILKNINKQNFRPCELQGILNDNYDDPDSCLQDIINF